MKPVPICLLSSIISVSALLPKEATAASVTIVAPTASTNGTVHFPSDIHFVITGSSPTVLLMLDEYVISDGNNTFSNPVASDIMVSVNSGSPVAGGAIFFDNGADPMEPSLENDGFFYLTGIGGLASGAILTIKAGTITYGAVSGFNPQASQTFTGNMYLMGITGSVIGVLVPEPSTGLLCTAAMAAFTRRRRHTEA